MLIATAQYGILNTNSTSFENTLFPTNSVDTFIKINVAKTPQNIPIGIDIKPKSIPSNNTFFLICFFVAPMLDNIPYCFIFSVIEIAKLFLITNTLETIIIPITIPAKEYSICNVPLSLVTPDHLSNSEFVV